MNSDPFLNIENILFTIAMGGYLVSMVLYALFFALKKEKIGKIADWIRKEIRTG